MGRFTTLDLLLSGAAGVFFGAALLKPTFIVVSRLFSSYPL